MRLSVSLFGPFRAELDGSELIIRSKRARAVLAMLVLAPKSAVSRDRLAATLWPDRSEEQARASLRQELSSLRRALGAGAALISADTSTVRLEANSVDRNIGSPSDGEFLEGLDLKSEPFDDWRREEAARRSAPDDADAAAEPEIFGNPPVLVMGLAPASADENDVTFATGLTLDLRTSLALWRSFPVIGPEAIGWKTDRDGPLADIAQTVGAAYAIGGAVRRAGDRIRVSVSLSETSTGHLVWTDTFDGNLADVFEMQEAISRGVVARVVPEIERDGAARVARRHPGSISAWQLVAQTEELERTGGEGYGTPESNRAQVPLLEEALRLEPDYARAWARLGRYYFRSAMQGWIEDRAEALRKGVEYCSRAVAVDPTDWEGQAYHALTLIFGEQDFGPGRFHALEAVRLNPSAPLARHACGCALEWLGETEQALHHLRRIFDLDPNYGGRAAALGDITTCELLLGNVDAAVDAARRLRDIAPSYCRGLQRVVVTLGHAGEIGEAQETLAKVMALQPDFDEPYVRETYPFAKPETVDFIIDGLRRAGWKG